mgnify:CR=1 FL=1
MTPIWLLSELASGDTVGLQLKSGATLVPWAQRSATPSRGPGTPEERLRHPSGQLLVARRQHGHTELPGVTKFWWGVYVQNAGDVLIEDNHSTRTGGKTPHRTGPAMASTSIANSQDVTVRRNRIADNGNEGFISPPRVLVTVDDERAGEQRVRAALHDSRRASTPSGTTARRGGTRDSRCGTPANNQLLVQRVGPGAAPHAGATTTTTTMFFTDRFEGRVFVGNSSVGNRFRVPVRFINPTGICLGVDTLNEDVCLQELLPLLLLGRESGDLCPRHPRPLQWPPSPRCRKACIKFPVALADFDLDATVDPNGQGVVQAAMGSSDRRLQLEPRADLDHDGKRWTSMTSSSSTASVGPCAANLVVTALEQPAAQRPPRGSFVTVSDTVQSQSRIRPDRRGRSTTSRLGTVKGAGDKLLGGRAVPALGAQRDVRRVAAADGPDQHGPRHVLPPGLRRRHSAGGGDRRGRELPGLHEHGAGRKTGSDDIGGQQSIDRRSRRRLPGERYGPEPDRVFRPATSRTQYYLSVDAAQEHRRPGSDRSPRRAGAPGRRGLRRNRERLPFPTARRSPHVLFPGMRR